jgi:hypothetical protein
MTLPGPASASYTSTSHHSDLGGYTSEQSIPLPLDLDDDDDFDVNLQEDMPILPSLLDDLLTPTELLQLSNTRVETTTKNTRPAVGVFSYSAVTKVGASTSKQPERIKPKTVDASHSAIIAAHAPELPPVLLEPTGTYVPFEAREPLCPFAIHGNCRFGETCRYLHGSECYVCKKRVLHPNASFEEHQGGTFFYEVLKYKLLMTFIIEHVAECQRTREKLETLKEHGTITDHKECVVCMEVVVTKKDPRFGIMSRELFLSVWKIHI